MHMHLKCFWFGNSTRRTVPIKQANFWWYPQRGLQWEWEWVWECRHTGCTGDWCTKSLSLAANWISRPGCLCLCPGQPFVCPPPGRVLVSSGRHARSHEMWPQLRFVSCISASPHPCQGWWESAGPGAGAAAVAGAAETRVSPARAAAEKANPKEAVMSCQGGFRSGAGWWFRKGWRGYGQHGQNAVLKWSKRPKALWPCGGKAPGGQASPHTVVERLYTEKKKVRDYIS